MYGLYTENLLCLKARTFFGTRPRQVPMPDNFCFREQPFQNNQQFLNSLKLQRIQGVARLALLIQTSLSSQFAFIHCFHIQRV